MNPIKSVKKFENEVLKTRLSKHWKPSLISFKKLFQDWKKYFKVHCQQTMDKVAF